MNLSLSQHWGARHKDIVGVEIVNSAIGERENWTYYLYLNERYMTPAMFEQIWLPARLSDAFDFVTYDYERSILGKIDMHGGMTFYEKRGEIKHRYVKVGCDYAHLFDLEHGPYRLEDIIHEARHSAEHAIEVLGLSKEPQLRITT